MIRVTIKQSKTDPFRKGIDLFIGKTESDLCPVAAILGYLVARGSQPGPLFVFQDGRFLRSAGGHADNRPRSIALLWPQLADRSGNHSGGKGRGGLRD